MSVKGRPSLIFLVVCSQVVRCQICYVRSEPLGNTRFVLMHVPRDALIAQGLVGHLVVAESEMPCSDDCSILDVSREEVWRHIVDSIILKRPETTELRWELTDQLL